MLLEFDRVEEKNEEGAQTKLPLLKKVQSILQMIGVGRSSDVGNDDALKREEQEAEEWRTFQYVDPWHKTHNLQFRYLKHRLVTRIQSNVRGMLVRRNMVRRLEFGVTKFQAAFRGYSVRVGLFRNVCRIEAVWRGVRSCFSLSLSLSLLSYTLTSQTHTGTNT